MFAAVMFWGLVAAVTFVTLCPIQLRPRTAHLHLERMMAFALLGASWSLAYPRRLGLAAAGVVALAISLELAQVIDPSRHGRIPDAMEKAAGGLLGVAAMAPAVLVLRRRGPKTEPKAEAF